MLVIGERINVITKVQREAMMNRDKGPIQEMAKRQVAAGAGMLDINIGPAEDRGEELMDWMVKTVQEAVQVPLCLDTTNPSAMEAGLKAHDNTWGRPMINSASGEEERLNVMMPLAGKYNSLIIGLTLNKQGIPALAEERCEIAALIMAKAMEDGVPMEDIYLDPLILPVPFSQDKSLESIRAIKLFRELNDPPMKTVVGLSNISNGAPKQMRPLINRVFTALLMYEGLDSAIIDPTEEGMMEVVKTVDILMGKTMYAHSYLEI
jgi:5-methyltetrahydrofolate corrinoid/iron sulfur protein methyltransferase